MSRRALELVMREVVRRNGVDNGIIYIQMTRAVAPRDHAFPARAETQVVMTARRARPQPARIAEEGVKAITLPDIRWQRCDIKSVSLLPNILAKQQAKVEESERALGRAVDLASSIEIGPDDTVERLGTIRLRNSTVVAQARGPPTGGSP